MHFGLDFACSLGAATGLFLVSLFRCFVVADQVGFGPHVPDGYVLLPHHGPEARSVSRVPFFELILDHVLRM